jgi:hypothetical protein
MEITAARQAASFAGAMLVLIGYAGHQLKWMDARKATYNVLNAAGSGILAYIAFRPFQLGFVVMEVSWVLLSIYALVRPRQHE